MHFFVPAVLFAAFAAANAGVLIAPAVAPVAHSTYIASPVIAPSVLTSPVISAPVIAKTVYSAPVDSLKTDEAFINGAAGTIHTKKVVSAQPAATLYAAPGLAHAPAVAVAYQAPIISAQQHIPPQVVHQY